MRLVQLDAILFLGLGLNGLFGVAAIATTTPTPSNQPITQNLPFQSVVSQAFPDETEAEKPGDEAIKRILSSPPSTHNDLTFSQSIESLGAGDAVGVDSADDPMNQVTSVVQLSDVQTTDWAFQALQSLVERYGCIAGYPDSTYRGNRALTRYEFAAGLNACLNRINELIQAGTSNLVRQEDLAALQTLKTQFAAELATLGSRVDNLEARTAQLEANQFSTTTKLSGLTIVGVQGRTENRADLFPRDGKRETDDPGTNPNIIRVSQLFLTTYFNPKSYLLVGLLDIKGSTAPRLTNDVRLAYEPFESDGFVLSDLNYHFLIGEKFAGFIGTEGVYTSVAFRGPNRVESSATGPLSYFAQRNPILNIGLGRGGAGFDWQFAKRASLQGIFSTDIVGFFPDTDRDRRGHNTAGLQFALTPTDTTDLTIYYVNDYSPNGDLLMVVGDSQLTADNPRTNQSAPLQTHAIGATFTWQLAPRLTLGTWGGYTHSYIPGKSGRVETINYMVFLNFIDLFGKGNLGGLYVGQPPKIINSDLPVGNNVPDFLDTGLGRSGGQPGTTTHVEAFYRWQVNENISLTPGIIVIFQPGHTSDSDAIAIGVLRTSFSF